MSHNLFRSILFACLFACASLSFPAFAQAGAVPAAAPPATNNADALTPDQARRALDTLQDDKKRAQIIDTLRAIATASPQGPRRRPNSKPPFPSPRTVLAHNSC